MEPCDENAQTITIPAEMPMIVLPDVHLLPGCMLPLCIFEKRYRLMLAHALESNRMFCVGNREGVDPDGSDRISPHSTAGLVRCCIQQEDGTSQLLLLGIKRIRITGWAQVKPFRIARVQEIPTVVESMEEARRLQKEALLIFKVEGDEEAREMRDMLEQNDDPEMTCDVLCYHFTHCPKLQQKLLGEPLLEERWRLLIAALKKMRRGRDGDKIK